MAISKNKKRNYFRLLSYVYTILITLVFICQLTVMYSPLVNTLAKNLTIAPDKREADAIVVLASGAYNDGSLGHFTLMRTLHGIKIYKHRLSKKIIFSGGNLLRTKLDISISRKMSELASEMGVPQEAQFVENRSLRTHQNALEVKKIMDRCNLKNALLVTSAIHMKRAILTFEQAGIKVYPAPVSGFESVVTDPLDRLCMFREIMREYVGLWYYKAKGWI